jgi:hypothetical protein
LQTITKKEIKLSASQISLFKRCKRAWYHRYIEKVKTPPKPWLRKGIEFHECIERMYKKIKGDEVELGLYSSDIIDMVKTGFKLDILYVPNTFAVEQPVNFQIMDDVSMVGYIDFLDVSNAKIVDHKTIKSHSWALKEDDLRADLQLNIYGYWYLSKLPRRNRVTFRHNQIHKTEPELSSFVEVEVSRMDVENYYHENVMPYVNEIVELSQDPEINRFSCDLSRCGDYGGCDYEKVCSKV